MSIGLIKRSAMHSLVQNQAAFQPTDLSSMTKVKLLEFSESIGLDLSASLSKAKVIDAISSSDEFKGYETLRKWRH